MLGIQRFPKQTLFAKQTHSSEEEETINKHIRDIMLGSEKSYEGKQVELVYTVLEVLFFT